MIPAEYRHCLGFLPETLAFTLKVTNKGLRNARSLGLGSSPKSFAKGPHPDREHHKENPNADGIEADDPQ